ncbi:MAG: ATP-binding protein [Ilumatobacter sp.]|uniref:ATP-binding protein n=1 Tax=Ilumatobacter sp. TaxID=1967498 RepID=UPI00391B2835
MSLAPLAFGPIMILVVDDDGADGEILAADLDRLLAGSAVVEVVADVSSAEERAGAIERSGGLVAVAFVDVDAGVDPSATVVEVHEARGLDRTRNVVVSSKASLHGVDRALQRGAIHGMLTRPWTTSGLRAQLAANLAAFLIEHAPDRLGAFDALLDADVRSAARSKVALQRAAVRRRPSSTPLLLDHSIDDAEIERRMVELLDRSLGHPPRIRVAPGSVMIEAGDDVGGIYVLLDGIVRLSTRTDTGEQILHEKSTGAIIGLLSLASRRRAMLTCRAITEVRAIPITLDQLAEALDDEPELASLLTRVLVGSLARRLRRSDELQMELDESLAALSQARAQLVASARFAALGEIAAGMAHELNNPTSALARAVEHVADDISAVVTDVEVRERIERHLAAPELTTTQRRELRRLLTDAIGDRVLADQLVELGVRSVAEATATVAASEGPESLERLIAGARLGRSLQTVQSAAGRIQTLVESLRSYSRGVDGRGPIVDDVDVAASIDDAIRLLTHRMGNVELVRRYSPTPLIVARPGELQQVWTNLAANALDALDGHADAQITVEVEAGEGGAAGEPGVARSVVVRIIDNGPGVPAELRERIFAPRFTTKGGRVQFGLGLGLSISRQIVGDHGGSITVDSADGQTRFVVQLPTGADNG